MTDDVDLELYYMLITEVDKLRYYFVKFAKVQAEDAMQKSIFHAMEHFNGDYSSLRPYLKKLAREIHKEPVNALPMGFIEDVTTDDTDDEEPRISIGSGRMSDFSNDIVDKLWLEMDKGDEIIHLALTYMGRFLVMCEAIINHDASDKYYPKEFISSALKLSKKFPNFNKLCVDLYHTYAEGMKEFIGLDGDVSGQWKESDESTIRSNTSNRIRLLNAKTHKEVKDADLEEFYLSGKLSGKSGDKVIVRVNYYNLWDYLCDLVDSKTSNQMKFIIGNHFIIKTLGGSVSVINPDLYGCYDLIRAEILTNVIYYTRGRVLNTGSTHIYMLCNKDKVNDIPYLQIKGIDINLEVEDITDTIL